MKKTYQTPEITMQTVNVEDVIVTSANRLSYNEDGGYGDVVIW